MAKAFVQVHTQCPYCKESDSIVITIEQFHRIQSGELIQIVLSNRTPDEREQLISGTCPDCWDKLF